MSISELRCEREIFIARPANAMKYVISFARQLISPSIFLWSLREHQSLTSVMNFPATFAEGFYLETAERNYVYHRA